MIRDLNDVFEVYFGSRVWPWFVIAAWLVGTVWALVAFFTGGDGSVPPGGTWRVECVDGTYSNAGGEQGACSHHGGVRSP